MKISIITPTFNSAGTIKDTLQSIATQSYKEVEHIIVDGMSTDNTLNIASTFPHVSKIISEPDLGIFDAMNKGIRSSTGDIVGILNSDDYYAHDKVLEYVAAAFKNNSLDAIYGNVYFVKPDNLVKIVRDYSSKILDSGCLHLVTLLRIRHFCQEIDL
ncbi:MAG: glycosyltransferase [Saprospiraceae bacterium]|nr:glycosyltransferase [Saprospiraceae bacterium]